MSSVHNNLYINKKDFLCTGYIVTNKILVDICIVLYCTPYDPPSRLLLTGEEPTFSYTKIYYIRPH